MPNSTTPGEAIELHPAYYVEQATLGFLSLVCFGLTFRQILEDRRDKKLPKPLRIAHWCNFLGMLLYVVCHVDPNALLGIYEYTSLVAVKSICVLILYISSQFLLFTHAVLIYKASLHTKAPRSMEITLQIGNTVTFLCMIFLGVWTAVANRAWVGGIPLFAMAIYAVYTLVFVNCVCTQLRRALTSHLTTMMSRSSAGLSASSAQKSRGNSDQTIQKSIRKINVIQIAATVVYLLTTAYEIYWGLYYISRPKDEELPEYERDVYYFSNPAAYVLLLLGGYALWYGCYKKVGRTFDGQHKEGASTTNPFSNASGSRAQAIEMDAIEESTPKGEDGGD